MDKYIAEFPEQLEAAIHIGNTIPELTFKATVERIIITGMGGSGIGAMLIKEFLKEQLSLPLEVNNDYTLPKYANEHTLVICSSYSGNTEETLSAFENALVAGCSIACITSGGKLQQLAAENNLLVVQIPGGMPPRTCLGYSMVAQLFVLLRSGWLDASIISDIKNAASFLRQQQENIKMESQSLASILSPAIPVIYASAAHTGIAIRWKQQINENAKMHCFAHVLPEMNHNELVAYHFANRQIAVIFLEDENDHPQIKKRFEWSEKTIAPQVHSTHKISMRGLDPLTRMFYTIHFGDWLSYFLSIQKGVDSIQIEILDQLKKALGN